MKNNQPLLETFKIFVIESLWILNNPYIVTFYAIILIVVIELRGGVQFGLKSYAWFQNHKYDFRPKLHYTKFNYLFKYYIHFEITHFFESVLVHTAGL